MSDSQSGYEKEAKRIEMTVATGQITPVRIDRYLTEMVQNASRNKVQQAISNKQVLVNGKPTKSSYIVQPGDRIEAEVLKPKVPELAPEAIPLNIVYEDEQIVIVNKPADMVVHPAFGNWTGTMVNALLHHSAELSDVADDENMRPGIVHRIDKGTSGLLVVARNDNAHQFLAAQFADHSTERTYHAIVWGTPPEEGSFDGPIGRSRRDRKLMAVTDEQSGKRAVTHYKVLEYFDHLALVEARLETGRTHQIRVHFSHAGFPLLGDETYGGASVRYGSNTGFRKDLFIKVMKKLDRQCLHAKTLGFIHPVSEKFVSFDSELPEDFQYALAMLREYCK